MKTKLAAVASAFALLGTITLTSRSAEASVFHRGGEDYTFAKSKGNFGAGLTAGAHYHTYDYQEACGTVPSPEDALALCKKDVEKAFKGIKVDAAVIDALASGCTSTFDASRRLFCEKDGKYLEGTAEAVVSAELFGKKADILGLEGYSRANSTSAVAGLTMSVVGKKVVGMERAARLEAKPMFVYPLFKAQASFGLGPLSVTVRAETLGSFGVDMGAEAGTAGVQFDGAPFASIDVYAGASVGKWLAEAGVEGTVNLTDLRLPSEVQLTLADSNKVRWSAASDLTFNALAGKIDLYGSLAGKRVGSISIFKWSGVPEKRYKVFEDSGFVTF